MTANYQNRLNQLQEYFERKNISLALISNPSNVFYYTGFSTDPHERFMALVWNSKVREFILFVPALDNEIARNESFIKKIVPISDEEDPFLIVQREIGNNLNKIGLEMKKFSMYRHQQLSMLFPGVEYYDIQPQINSQRMKKTKKEIDYLQEAVDIIENVLKEGIKKVKLGMSETDLTAELEYLMKKMGAEGPAFSTIVLSGNKSALPHGVPGNRKFQKGDFLLIDFGVKTKNGYCSDITRTFVIGEASKKQREIYNIVLESNKAGINAVQAGQLLKNFDLIAREVINQNGYSEYFNNRIGHGLGIDVHEEPSIHGNNEELAESGLFFTIEPGIYIPELGGVRIEDEVYINENGSAEVLTSFPKEFQIL